MKEKNKKGETFFNKLSLLLISISITVIGLIAYIIAPKLGPATEIVKILSQMVITISISSLMIEYFGYVNYARKRIAEVMSEDCVLNILDKKRKKELKSAILRNLYMPNKDAAHNDLVNVIDSELDNILKDYFYDEYIIYVDISDAIEDGKHYIKKVIRKIYTAETINNAQCNIGQLLDVQINPVRGAETIKVDELKINGEEIENVEFKGGSNMEDVSNNYLSRFTVDTSKFEDKLEFRDKISIDIKYITYTPYDDRVYSNQVDKPCKHYCVHFNYSQEFEMDIVGFGFMTNGNHDKKRIVKTQNGRMLRFLSWILPGDGVMAVILKRDECEKKYDNK